MKAMVFAVLSVILFSYPEVSGQPGTSNTSDLLVTPGWLANHLNDDDLVLLHAHWNSGGYKRGHVPGARFLWLNALSKDTPELSTELPSVKEAAAVLRDLGITDRSRIVVYFEGQNVTMTTRMILTLAYFGLGDRVSLLDGGLEAWKGEGRPVSKDTPKVNPGSFIPKLHPDIVTDADWVSKHLSDRNVTVIDTRAQRFFDGTTGTPPGHIPHAISIPFSSVVDSTNRLLHPDTLRELFVRAGVKPGTQIVTYCHVGQQATLVYFAAKYIGYNATVYDGSFQDWSDRENLPIENPSEKK